MKPNSQPSSSAQSKARYALWGAFLKSRRETRYRSARTFCAEAQIGISYPQYSRYESGEQLPSLEQAITLCCNLGVPPQEGLLHWNLAQMPESEAGAALATRLRESLSGSEVRLPAVQTSGVSPSSGAGAPAPGGAVKLDELIVFNRSHLKLFGADPVYRDIFTYINSYSPESIEARELAEATGVPLKELMPMLRELHESGVILLKGERCLAAKRLFYFPDDDSFFPVRNLNFVHNTSQILRRMTIQDLADKKAYRALISRELTPAQLDQLVARLDQLVHETVELQENGEPQKIFSLCLLLGERFDRQSVLSRLDNS